MPSSNTEKQSPENDNEQKPLSNPCCCSFAVTQETKIYQSIFVCRTCCEDKEELFCICEACANHCHEYHDEVDYLGMGMAYCDCSRLGTEGGCKIIKRSEKTAKELNISSGNIVTRTIITSEIEQEQRYIMDAYSIPDLQERPPNICNALIQQASELIKHSRETFWLDESQDPSKFCDLEKMAWRVMEQHRKHYGIDIVEGGGAEWWVQVKKPLATTEQEKVEEPFITEITSLEEGNSPFDHPKSHNTPGSEAVDLHYDKDESLAEKFGLGSFPTLSTVTYLTPSSNPTVIFTHTYEQEDDEVMPEMLVSHPLPGKHLVFDGRLLHGAPSHKDLRNTYDPSSANANENEASNQERVTLLVNVWANRKPAGVNPLSNEIRKVIKKNTKKMDVSSSKSPAFVQKAIETIELEDDKQSREDEKEETESSPAVKDRIELPFVCKGITWESEDDDSAGLVVVTCAPPKHQSDTIRVRFGPGLQAYLDHACDEAVEEDPNIVIANGAFTYEDAYV